MAKEGGKTPVLLYFLEEPMLLLFLGVTVYAVFYLIWGLMELANMPRIPDELRQAVLGGK